MARMEYVTTDCDMWNSADEAHFFVSKGQVKSLPEIISPIIEDGISQGLLREPTKAEMNTFVFDTGLEQAIKEKKIKAGKSYDETAGLYQAFLNAKEEPKEESPTEVLESAGAIKAAEPAETPVSEEQLKEAKEKEEALKEKEKTLKEKEKALWERGKKVREKEKALKEK